MTFGLVALAVLAVICLALDQLQRLHDPRKDLPADVGMTGTAPTT